MLARSSRLFTVLAVLAFASVGEANPTRRQFLAACAATVGVGTAAASSEWGERSLPRTDTLGLEALSLAVADLAEELSFVSGRAERDGIYDTFRWRAWEAVQRAARPVRAGTRAVELLVALPGSGGRILEIRAHLVATLTGAVLPTTRGPEAEVRAIALSGRAFGYRAR